MTKWVKLVAGWLALFVAGEEPADQLEDPSLVLADQPREGLGVAPERGPHETDLVTLGFTGRFDRHLESPRQSHSLLDLDSSLHRLPTV